LRAKILFTEGLAKQRKPKYQRRIVQEENFPMFKMPPMYIRELEEIALLGIDLSTLIEKLVKGEL
jgi:transposase